MHFTTLALTALTLAAAPLVQAVGNATVTNNCADPIYVWSVGGSVGAEQTIAEGESFSEPFRRDARTGGIALKITRTEGGLYSGAPQTTFSYSLDNNQVWYDLSDTFGDAFDGSSLEIKPADDTCQPITWASGTPPAGSQVKVCQSESDLVLTTC